METTALSSSALTELAAWARTRLLRTRILVLWVVLVGAAALATPGLPPARLGAAAAFLAAAVALLRLWDDLADRHHDRLAHPGRVLERADRQSVFTMLLALGLLVGLPAAILPDVGRAAVYALLLLGLAGLYHGGAGWGVPRPRRAALVLVKYPVLLFLVGAGPSVRAWLIGLGLYVGLLLYEWRNDAELRAVPVVDLLPVAGAGAALVSLLFLAGSTRP